MCELVAPYKVRCVKDVPAEAFIAAFSQHLKSQGKVQVPQWAEYVKTGVARELSPYNADWFFVRMAAIARRVYINPNVGVGAFKKIFGTKQRNGGGHNSASLGSGKVIRLAVQQLQKLGLLEASKASKGGRVVSSKGRQEMDYVAVHAAAPLAAKTKQAILTAAVNADEE
jgi:small subunit ribosomal protein S19e